MLDDTDTRTPALFLDGRKAVNRALWIVRNLKAGTRFRTTNFATHTVQYVAAGGKAVKCIGEPGFVFFRQIAMKDGKPVPAYKSALEESDAIVSDIWKDGRRTRNRTGREMRVCLEAAAEMRRNGASYQEICRRTKMRHWVLRKHGIPTTVDSPERKARTRRVLGMYLAGEKIEYILAVEHMGAGTLYGIIRNAGATPCRYRRK